MKASAECVQQNGSTKRFGVHTPFAPIEGNG